ncbi:MAG: hypothetical protein U1F08_10725 [Steroidobacteraceae bacterium]
MNGTPDERLDRALAELPAGVEPATDLWPGIAARLEPRPAARRGAMPAWAGLAAAGVVLVAATALVTATLVRRETLRTVEARTQAEVAAELVPAAFAPAGHLGAGYAEARRQLAADLEHRLATMPPEARLKLEHNLAEMRRAAEEINAALERRPGDPLLEELLLNTYQDELGVIASVNQLTTTAYVARPAGQENLRL